MVKQGPQIIVLCVQRAHPRDCYLAELTGQDVWLTPPLLLFGDVSYTSVSWLLSKPTFLSNR